MLCAELLQAIRNIFCQKITDSIEQYISTTLGLSEEDSRELNARYYKEHGLTVIGLQRFHQVDSMDFNRRVDDRLPMHKLLSRSAELIQFFSSFDRSRVKLWLFTNAHITHALRVVGLLGIAHFFEGITYCDYSSGIDRWTCKPSQAMLDKAEREAGVLPTTRCFYVDDSIKNCTAAAQRGWQVLWIQNGRAGGLGQTLPARPLPVVDGQKSLTRIESLLQICSLIPHLFTDCGRIRPERVAAESEELRSSVANVPISLCAGA